MDIYLFRAEIVATAPPPDVTGWDVEATDGHIGKVDEATYENRSGVPRRRHRVLDLRQAAPAAGRRRDRASTPTRRRSRRR